jgi:hypothetical protein
MKTLCYSVRLESLVSISEKAYCATSFDGSSCIIPKSQVFGDDFSVVKSDAYWISAWILERKDIQYSTQKRAWFDEHGNKFADIKVVNHKAAKVEDYGENRIDELHK